MKNKKSLFNTGFWNVLNTAVLAIGAFISMPIIINSIGTDIYGLFSIILMIGGFAALQDFGLGEATLRYVSLYHARNDLEGVNRVVQSTTSVYLITVTIVFGLLQLLAIPIINLFKLAPDQITLGIQAFRVASISFFIATLAQAMQRIPEALLRYDATNKANIVFAVMRFSAMILVVRMGYGIVGLVWVIVAIALSRLVFFFLLAKKLIPGITLYPKYSKAGVNEVVSFSIFSFINQIITQVSQYADRLVLGIFFSTADVGYLSAPKDIIQRASGITGAAGQALFPKFSSMQENLQMANLYSRSIWMLSLFSMMLLIPLAVIIPDFLRLWISPEFSDNSAQFARLFSLGMAFNGGVTVYFALLKGTGRINWLTRIMSSLTVISTIGTFLLVYHFGIIGSGIRTILFSWIGTLICIVVGKKIFKNHYSVSSIVELGLVLSLSGILVYLLGIELNKAWNIENWIILIFQFCLFSMLMGLIGFISNILLFPSTGSANFLFFIVKKKLTKIK